MYHLIFVVKIKNNMRVCILGNSLSSLTLAKALVNQKIYVDQISQNKSCNINKTRTIGISTSNIEFFNKKIININKILWKLKKIEIYSDNLKNEKLLNFEKNNEYLFSIVKNYKLIGILEKNLSKNKYFRKISLKKKFTSFNNYCLVINTEYNNSITKKYFNKKIEKKYNSFAYTSIFEHEKIINNTAVQIFTKFGPLAFLPVSNNETSVVYSVNKSSITKKINISELICKYNFKYRIKKIHSINSVELKSTILRSYYYDNILAFGDLNHKIHPLAGQGFNMTIRDIMNLAKIFEKKINLGLPLDKSINKEFEKISKYKNNIYANGIDLIYEFFNIERKFKNKLLSKTIQIVGANFEINKILTKFADRGIFK